MIRLFFLFTVFSGAYGMADNIYTVALESQERTCIDFYSRCDAFERQCDGMETIQRAAQLKSLSAECEKIGSKVMRFLIEYAERERKYVDHSRVYDLAFSAYDYFKIASERIRMYENNDYSTALFPFSFGSLKEGYSTKKQHVWKVYVKTVRRKFFLEERLFGNGPVKEVSISDVVNPMLFLELKNKIDMIYDLIESRSNFFEYQLSQIERDRNSNEEEEIQKNKTYAQILLENIQQIKSSISPENYKIDALIKMYAILQLDLGLIGISKNLQIDMLGLFDNIHIPHRERFNEESVILDLHSRDIFFLYSDNYFENIEQKDGDLFTKIKREISELKDKRSKYTSLFPHLKQFENKDLTQLLKVADRSIRELNQDAFKETLSLKSRYNFPKFVGVISHVGLYIDLLDKLEVEKNKLFNMFDQIISLSKEEKVQFEANRIPKKEPKKGKILLTKKKPEAREVKAAPEVAPAAQPAVIPTTGEVEEIDYDAQIRALRLEKWRAFCAQQRNIRTTPSILHDIAVDVTDPVLPSHDFNFALFSGSPDKFAIYNELRRIGARVMLNPNATGKDFVHLTLQDKKYIVIFHFEHGIDKGVNFAGYRRLQSILRREI